MALMLANLGLMYVFCRRLSRSREVAAVAQDDTDRVVRQRGVVHARLAGQHGARGEQRVLRPRHGQREQLGRVEPHALCIRISRFHLR